MIEYVRERYGRGVGRPDRDLRDDEVARGGQGRGPGARLPPGEADRLTKLIPSGPALRAHAARRRPRRSPSCKRPGGAQPAPTSGWWTTAAPSKGSSRHISVHAAGVVIAPGPLTDYVPVCTMASKGTGRRERRGRHRHAVRHGRAREGRDAQDGLPRASRPSPSSTRAVRAIRERRGVAIDLDAARPRGPGGLRDAPQRPHRRASSSSSRPSPPTRCAQMRCDRFDDLVASNALMRPGPLDSGMHLRLHPAQARRGAGPLRAAGAPGDPRAHLRRHRLPGAGDAHRERAGGHLARRSRRAPQGGGQEERRS